MQCERTATELIILIDNVVRGSAPLASTYNINTTGSQVLFFLQFFKFSFLYLFTYFLPLIILQVTVGAKSAGNNNDQYHGAIDDVSFSIIS